MMETGGLVVMGVAGCGKTRLLETLASAVSAQCHVVSPKSVSLAMLYGHYDTQNQWYL